MFQGLLRAHKDYHDTKSAMARLWVHECYRVFSDRLVGERDHETFASLVAEKLGSIFDLSFNNLCSKQLPIFGDFMKGTSAEAVYEDITSFKDLKQFMENSLDDYNNEPGVIAMNLVLFKDAIEHGEAVELTRSLSLHVCRCMSCSGGTLACLSPLSSLCAAVPVCRIVRVIRQPRGNMLLVGIGGSGRQSLTRLAAYIIGFQVFQVEVTRHYRLQEFREGEWGGCVWRVSVGGECRGCVECECGGCVECVCGGCVECVCGGCVGVCVEGECGGCVECECRGCVECECGGCVECVCGGCGCVCGGCVEGVWRGSVE